MATLTATRLHGRRGTLCAAAADAGSQRPQRVSVHRGETRWRRTTVDLERDAAEPPSTRWRFTSLPTRPRDARGRRRGRARGGRHRPPAARRPESEHGRPAEGLCGDARVSWWLMGRASGARQDRVRARQPRRGGARQMEPLRASGSASNAPSELAFTPVLRSTGTRRREEHLDHRNKVSGPRSAAARPGQPESPLADDGYLPARLLPDGPLALVVVRNQRASSHLAPRWNHAWTGWRHVG